MNLAYIKRKYGDKDEDGYVWCASCPIYDAHEHESSFCDGNCSGYEDCYTNIKNYLDSLEEEEKMVNAFVPDNVNDNVNHPNHYTHGGIECIDAMESAFGIEAVQHFCACNAFKYIFRFLHKNGLEDIDKACWYLNKYKALEGKKNA